MAKVIDKEVLQKLVLKKKILLDELKRIDDMISLAKGDGNSREMQWTYRAMDCIRGWDEFVQTVDILNCMFHDNMQALEDPQRKRNYLVGLSVALNKMVKNGVLAKASFVGVKGNFYGLAEWMKNAKEPKAPYGQKLKKRLHEKIAV